MARFVVFELKSYTLFQECSSLYYLLYSKKKLWLSREKIGINCTKWETSVLDAEESIHG